MTCDRCGLPSTTHWCPDCRALTGNRQRVTTILRPASWMALASCRGSTGWTNHTRVTPELAATCDACPVRQECLDHALANRTLTGVWAGTTSVDRRRIRQETP